MGQREWKCLFIFRKSIIGNFMVYLECRILDQLETALQQQFPHTECLEWFSRISVIGFEVNLVAEEKQAHW